ncbi:MAG: hypothetical protein M1832_003095 [Thelocarpon impressellum]|nr:MAG: hypothetical protein M1832_003095 [Thelocarpon impressellum]
MLYATSILHWLRRKRYQYEVTFSLYMLTPAEKFIFNSFLFLFLSMIVIAASLYFPQHVTKVLSRAWFYYAGEEVDVDALGGGTGGGAGGGGRGKEEL